ncbi:unnamed protein product, partial [Brenthis ino]
MEDTINNKLEHCLGCLNLNEEINLQCYKLQIENLKTLFQVDCLKLCYICKKLMRKAEYFIKNVESNQIFMQNFSNITDTTNKTVKSKFQTTRTEQLTLDKSEFSDENDIEEPSCTVYSRGWDNKIKIEYKEESINDLEGDFTDYLDIQDQSIKGESDSNDNSIKEESTELDDINLNELRKTLKSHKVKKKGHKRDSKNNIDFKNSTIKGEDNFSFKNLVKEENTELSDIKLSKHRRKLKRTKFKSISTKSISTKSINISDNLDLVVVALNITREQCMVERSKMLKDPKYMNLAYKCEDCVKGFNFKGAYEKHMEKHSKEMGEYECDICKQRMATMDKLMSHQRYHRIRYKCIECDLIRISRLTIKDHYTAHHLQDTFQYKCSHCNKTFKRQVSLRKHIADVHRSKKRPQCNYCQRTYANKEILKTHMISKHSSEVTSGEIPSKKYVCSECGDAFKAPSQLKNHMIKHSVNRNYYCVECNRSFKSNNTLKQHLKIAAPHVNYMDLPFQCNHCEKRFSVRRDVDRHMNRVHLNIKPYQCDKCDKAYVNAWSLTEHSRFAHEGYKRPLNFPCPLCDKVFDRNATRKAHIRTHTGERPFQCPRCAARFAQAGVLATHVRLVHLRLARDGRPRRAADTAAAAR